MYTIKRRAVDDFVAADAIDLTTAAVHTTYKVVQSQMDVTRLMVTVLVATVSTGNIVVTFERRPTIGSAAGKVNLGTIVIPTAQAAGKTFYKDISPTQVNPGEQIVFEVTTAAAGGGAAGTGFCNIELSDSPEAGGNQSLMVASA